MTTNNTTPKISGYNVDVYYQQMSLNSCSTDDKGRVVIGNRDEWSQVVEGWDINASFDRHACNQVYALLNKFAGASFKGAGADHTSMSVGDIIVVRSIWLEDGTVHRDTDGDDICTTYAVAKQGFVEISHDTMWQTWIEPTDKLLDYIYTRKSEQARRDAQVERYTVTMVSTPTGWAAITCKLEVLHTWDYKGDILGYAAINQWLGDRGLVVSEESNRMFGDIFITRSSLRAAGVPV